MRHFFVSKNSNYEEIPEEDDDDDKVVDASPSSWKQQQYQQRKRNNYQLCRNKHSSSRRAKFLLLLVCLLLLTVLYWAFHYDSIIFGPDRRNNNANTTTVIHKETIPTLFSLIDPVTHQFVYALDNPVYETIKNSQLLSSSDKMMLFQDDLVVEEFPEIVLDLQQHNNKGVSSLDDDDEDMDGESSFKHLEPLSSSLTISWTPGKDVNGDDVVSDNDLLLLYCSDDSSDLEEQDDDDDDDNTNIDHRGGGATTLLEAATLAQVRATHARNSPNLLCENENQWYIPHVPSSAIRLPYCQFRLYHNNKNNEYYQVAKSSVVTLSAAVNKPIHIHLSFTSSPDVMLVQFVTTAVGTPVAQIIMDEDGENTRMEKGTSVSYSAHDLCQAPANQTEPGKFHPPGYLHTVPLTQLTPNTVYRYKVGLATGQGVTWSSKTYYTFTTALPAGDTTEHSYLVYGDQGCPELGWGEGGQWITALAVREMDQIRSIHHFGDLSYAQGAAHQWDNWFEMIQPVSTTVPLMIAVGNHEYDHESGGTDKDPSGIDSDSGFMPVWGNFGNDSGGECGVPTAKRFTMPDTGNGVFWYSYDYGLVHTVVISSEHDLLAGSAQHEWLHNDLKCVDRKLTPWLIVESHRPLYEGEIFFENYSVGVAMRYEIEDLLYDYNVDMFLAGHYHAYHRTCDGLYRSKCNRGGPIHLTIGSAGAHLDDASVEIFTNSWTENVILQTYGYGRITVKNATALHFEFVKAGNETDPTSGDVLDSVWITRKR